MKKLLIILSLFITAFSTLSVMPPGWYQQTLPVNDFVNDIYFVDTLTGWIVTQGHTNNNDTAYIMKTTNGGDNWNIQYARNVNLTTVQFVNSQTGYVGGGSGSGTKYLYKTTNGGSNWNQVIGTLGGLITDEHFYNSDTGWYCADSPFDGGLFKTTNGGGSWVQQLNNTYEPLKLFFINKDTGWVSALYDGSTDKVLKTTNGGLNWILQYSFPWRIRDIFFVNNSGWVTTGSASISFNNGIFKTANGGANWVQQIDPNPSNSGLGNIYFVNELTGYIATSFSKIIKTTNGGTFWGKQSGPDLPGGYNRISFVDTSTGWAAGGNNIIHTTDGGGAILSIVQTNNEIPINFKLHQNYPNPFNPLTRINYELQITNYVTLTIYDINGKIIKVAVNEKQSAGRYQYTFDGSNLTSGVYFYRLQTENFIETKKMILTK